MEVPNGDDWIEYMLNISPTADHHTLGVRITFRSVWSISKPRTRGCSRMAGSLRGPEARARRQEAAECVRSRRHPRGSHGVQARAEAMLQRLQAAHPGLNDAIGWLSSTARCFAVDNLCSVLVSALACPGRAARPRARSRQARPEHRRRHYRLWLCTRRTNRLRRQSAIQDETVRSGTRRYLDSGR